MRSQLQVTVAAITAAFLTLAWACDQQGSQKLAKNSLQHDSSPKDQQQQPNPSHYEQLKELEWLVGNWIDKGEKVSVSLSFRWDQDKNFLIEDFTMNKLDKPELFGHEIITWDPAEKKIRSWIFDSDGGFGESTWTKKDNSWYVGSIFTLPDGRKGSATHIYTKIDDNTYTFASQSRDIDGTVLPDIGPFKTIRVQ